MQAQLPTEQSEKPVPHPTDAPKCNECGAVRNRSETEVTAEKPEPQSQNARTPVASPFRNALHVLQMCKPTVCSNFWLGPRLTQVWQVWQPGTTVWRSGIEEAVAMQICALARLRACAVAAPVRRHQRQRRGLARGAVRSLGRRPGGAGGRTGLTPNSQWSVCALDVSYALLVSQAGDCCCRCPHGCQ